MMQQATRATAPKCVCASEHVKLIGNLDGTFPDFGHHQEREMGGLWMHPIKVLDGFWLKFCDRQADNVDTWILADRYACRPEGNSFYYTGGLGHTAVAIERRQFAPQSVPGLIVTYVFQNRSDAPRDISAVFAARTELCPVWFSQAGGIVDGERDEGVWEEAAGRFMAKDCDHDWFAGIQSMPRPDSACVDPKAGPYPTAGRGTGLTMTYHFQIPASGSREITFYITSSINSREECMQRLCALINGKHFLREIEERTQSILSRSRLRLPQDQRFCDIYDWVKVNTDWLIVDAGPYGRGLSAGLPEYPWWFGCDNCYALQGVLVMGDYELCRDTLKLLAHYAKKVNGNGRIPHEITTFGICANPGNTQETAHFVTMVWHYYQWTGDLALMRELMPLLKKCIAWLKAQDDDGDSFPSGYGIIEIAGLNAEMIDTAVYTCQAYGCYAGLCLALGRAEDAKEARQEALKAAQAIDQNLWDEAEGLYCDAYASPAFVLEKRDSILGRASGEQAARMEAVLDALIKRKQAQGEGESGWLINRNWIINTPMEAGIAPADKAARALQNLHTPEYIGPWGMYLNALNPSAIMTISTGAMAVAQARYGYADRALELIGKMFSTFGMASPGTLSEMSPDYGCFVQAWTAYAVFTPIVRHFFGIQPMAGEKTLHLKPVMPSAWTEASLESVRVLDGVLDIHFARIPEGCRYEVRYTGTAAIAIHALEGRSIRLNGRLSPAGKAPMAAPGECVVEILG